MLGIQTDLCVTEIYIDAVLLIFDSAKQPLPIRERADAACLDVTSTPDVPGWR